MAEGWSALATEWGGPAQIWKLTPRQFVLWLSLSRRRERRELGVAFTHACLAMRGEEKAVKAEAKRLDQED